VSEIPRQTNRSIKYKSQHQPHQDRKNRPPPQRDRILPSSYHRHVRALLNPTQNGQGSRYKSLRSSQMQTAPQRSLHLSSRALPQQKRTPKLVIPPVPTSSYHHHLRARVPYSAQEHQAPQILSLDRIPLRNKTANPTTAITT